MTNTLGKYFPRVKEHELSKGNFFAVGGDEFATASKLGMNPAVAFLVMARGTQADNATTAWSALACFNHSGMARRRAQTAIGALIDAGLVHVLREGKKPLYRLKKPDDDKRLIWLPNEIIDGAGGEIPPITRLRETDRLDLLQVFILLYGLQDLDNDGGIPRKFARSRYTRTKVCDVGHMTLYGFKPDATTATACGIFERYHKQKDEDGNQGAWIALTPLSNMGLIEHRVYMAESDDDESELIYPFNEATKSAVASLLYSLEGNGAYGFVQKATDYDDVGLAPQHIKKATMIGLYRMKYRPKTGKTGRWWAMENQQTDALVTVANTLLGVKKAPVVHIKAYQG